MTGCFAEFRLKNEMGKLTLLPNTTLERVQCSSEMHICEYLYTVSVGDGIYGGRTYNFQLLIPEAYPFESPKIRCMDPIYHPNIDSGGNVCLEFLRHQWSSSMGIEWVTLGIYLFLVEPQGEEALNTEAGDLLLEDYEEFVRKARNYRGNGS